MGSVSKLKHVGNEISYEITDQCRLLDEMERCEDKIIYKQKTIKAQLETLINTSTSHECLWVINIVLFITLILLLVH